MFLLNCEQSSRNNLFEWSQFKRNRRNISHFAEKKRSWNQAFTRNQTVSSFLGGNEFFVINTKLVFHNGSEILNYILLVYVTLGSFYLIPRRNVIYTRGKNTHLDQLASRLSRIGFIGSIQSVMRSFSMGSIQSIMTSFHFQLGLSSLL